MIAMEKEKQLELRQLQRRGKDRQRLITATVALMLSCGMSIDVMGDTFELDVPIG